MSCSCGCNPCSCSPRPAVCCTPTVESVTYTFENGNIIGIGVFDNETDNLVQFRGIYSDASSLTVTLDAGNNAIKLSFDPNALVADIPDATTTQRGILETATNAEALAKAAADKTLTPSNLAALGSTTSFAGLVELATNAETITGTSTTLAVTPAGLAAASGLYSTTTFADAAGRGGATPSFNGQLGSQLDVHTAWVSTGTSAGSWTQLLTLGENNVSSGTSTTNIQLNGDGFIFDGLTGGGGGSVILDHVALSFVAGIIYFDSAASIRIDGVSIPANSVWTTGASNGQISSSLISTFVSSANTQTGYTSFSNPATLRTCDTATVTLQQLAQIVGTLIGDLKAIKLPAT